jgi:hypothetical protein
MSPLSVEALEIPFVVTIERSSGAWPATRRHCPRQSIARTANVCDPIESPLNAFGDAHAPHAPVSSRHSNRAPGSLDENEKLAALDLYAPDGPDGSSVVSGGFVSIVNDDWAGVGSEMPALLIARTAKLWGPSCRLL